MLVQMSIVHCRHLGESVDQFCGDSCKVCVRCMSVAIYMWLPVEIVRQACCCINMLASSTRSVGSCMLLNVWHVKIAFELDINKQIVMSRGGKIE